MLRKTAFSFRLLSINRKVLFVCAEPLAHGFIPLLSEAAGAANPAL